MNLGEQKAVLKYAERKYKGEYEFKFNNEKGEVLLLVVDCSKVDKNSPDYNERYAKPLLERPERKGPKILFNFKKNVVDDVKKDVKEYLDISVMMTGYWFKNYDYLDNIEEKIIQGVKKMPEPWNQINPIMSADQEYPKIKLTFYNIPSGTKDEFFKNQKDFNEEFNKYEPSVDLSQYIISITYSKKD